jgi:2-methylcitrate dehydratase PrpD
VALLDELAGFITHVTFDGLSSETVNQAKLHIFDSLGAGLAGACTEEAKANGNLIEEMFFSKENTDVPVKGFGFPAPLPFAILLSCITIRLTETDDIDIASCTTPGSVIVPTALLLAFKNGAKGKEFIEGVVTGYEILTRLGAAVNGPEIIYRGIWPTCLCAAIGVATVGSKILSLTPEQIKNALAISLTLSTGISGRIKGGLTSRWLTLGCAAQNGLIACLGASRGFAGDQTVVDMLFPSVYGLDLKPQILLEGLGERFQIGKVNLKPYCSARQTIASIEAFRWLLNTYPITPEAIEEIEVIVPRQYSQMIDRPGFPEDRLSSITSIQYQLAIAAFYEEDLFDVERKFLRDEKKVHTLMEKIHVKPCDPFTAIYPKKWPGKISLQVDGKRYKHEVLAPKGNSDQPMTWEDVELKTKRLTRPFFDPSIVEKLGALVKSLEPTAKVDALLRFLENPKGEVHE